MPNGSLTNGSPVNEGNGRGNTQVNSLPLPKQFEPVYKSPELSLNKWMKDEWIQMAG